MAPADGYRTVVCQPTCWTLASKPRFTCALTCARGCDLYPNRPCRGCPCRATDPFPERARLRWVRLFGLLRGEDAPG